MELLLLVARSAFRNRLRTSLTAVGVGVTIIAFLFLRTFIGAWYAGVDAASADRLIVRNKISITFPLPLSYVNKVRAVPGVSDISFENWFGGVYKEPKNFFAQFASDAESVLRVYPEIELPPDQKAAWLGDRKGCIVGEMLAEKYGFKVGDKIVLKGTIYPGDYDLTVRGIYTSSGKSVDLSTLFFHWQYLNESVVPRMKDQVGILLVRVADPGRSVEVAGAIDKLFQSSLAETRSESEKAFQLSFISMSSVIIDSIQVISFVILVILLLILGNTLAMATRERTTEYATMRAIGFRPRHIVGLVLGEGFIVGAAGAAVGVGLATPILRWAAAVFQRMMPGFLGSFRLSGAMIAISVTVALVGGMLAAAIPAYRAGKLKIVDALRRLA
jgi:putative ABC transport system permease protein